MGRTARRIFGTTGALLVLSGIAHALHGWVELRRELQQASVPADLAREALIGWWYGSGAMLAFGVIAILAGVVGGKDAPASALVVPVSLLYLSFGIGAFALTGGNPHFLGFIVLGALLATGLWAARRARLQGFRN